MADSHQYALILAGGRGTRFWPRSRRRSAKQVLNVVGARSLIQNTVARLRPLIAPERMWILTNDYLRGEIVRQLPEIPEGQILAEPAQRNTAAIGLAACILQSIDPEAVMGVFSADHVIAREGRYRQLVRGAFRHAQRGNMVVLGILPRWPEPGYGYIEFPRGTEPGPAPVVIRRFREKPDLPTAKRYVASGRFFWNAGMFFWPTSVLLDELRKNLPRTASILASLPPFHDASFSTRLREAFPLCEDISIDYAVLEKAETVAGIACPEIGWNDVGSWNAVYELLPHDGNGNVVLHDGVLQNANGNYIDAAKGKMVALVGVSDLIVVDTPDALLIADRNAAQKVGEVVKILEQRKRDELL